MEKVNKTRIDLMIRRLLRSLPAFPFSFATSLINIVWSPISVNITNSPAKETAKEYLPKSALPRCLATLIRNMVERVKFNISAPVRTAVFLTTLLTVFIFYGQRQGCHLSQG
jgi:hypothetical protein